MKTKRQKRLTENQKRWIGQTIEIKWGVSRGRDSYGYTTAVLRSGGVKIAGCNGGGYDMRGTVVGNFLTYAFAEELRRLKPADMPEDHHWEPARNPRRICRETDCLAILIQADKEVLLAPDVVTCPQCGKETDIDGQDGKRVSDGHRLYGLTFHDPDYDPGKAVIGQDCTNRTMAGERCNGKTVAESEAAGESLGLERYQAVYRASSPVPTRRHRIPSIDGACGMSSVECIARAIGIGFRSICDRKNLDIYEIMRTTE